MDYIDNSTGVKAVRDYQPELPVACAACPAGTASLQYSDVCVQCPPGYYQDETGQASCKKAEKGWYVNETGANSTKPCGSGTFGSVEGMTMCIPCGVSNSMCIPCGILSKYKNQMVPFLLVYDLV